MTTEAFADRLFQSVLGTLESISIYLGDQLGLYRSLHQHGRLTSDELARDAGIDDRYAWEWVEQQAVIGIIDVDDAALPAAERRYSLPAAHAEVLVDRDSIAHMTPFVRIIGAAAAQLPLLLDAYRTGGGVSWEQFGDPMRTGQAEANRPWFLGELSSRWFPSVPDLQRRLEDGAVVADIGCGEGWSAIGMALGYPAVRVHGYDIDEASVAAARQHAAEYGVDDRVQFFLGDAADVAADRLGQYDVVTAFECIHDMPDPVSVLATMRGLVSPQGTVVVMDERVPEEFSGASDDLVEQLNYGVSLIICLPDGLSHAPSVGTGTVMRPGTFRDYVRAAGFSDIETLPIENDLWRFYRLV